MNAISAEAGWMRICDEAALLSGAGVAAHLGETQVAIFCAATPAEGLWAVGNYDPIGGANVMSRGIIGDISDEPVVSSPLYKQHFSLLSGTCLEDENYRLPVYPAALRDGGVWIEMRRAAD